MVCAVTALTLVTGCGRDISSPESRGSRDSGAPDLKAPMTSYDPPRTFGKPGVPLPKEAGFGPSSDIWGSALGGRLPVTLYKTWAYIASPYDLQAVNTDNGRVTTVLPQHEALVEPEDRITEELSGPPLLASVGGRSQIIVPFGIQIPGSGTTAATRTLELTAVDADSAAQQWRTQLQLPDWARRAYGKLAVTMVGGQGSTAVVKVANSYHSTAYAIDLETHRVLWQQDLAAMAVTGGNIAVFDRDTGETRLRTVDLLTGETTWTDTGTAHQVNASVAGPNVLHYSGNDYKSGHEFTKFLNARTGELLNNVENLARVTCTYDGKATTVCSGKTGDFENPDQVFAVDATTGKLLWKLPDTTANRVAPSITTAWNGRVYGTTRNGPVALDARTGADTTPGPGLAPVLVNGYTGLAIDGRTVTAHRTTS
ncbi:hypothetical protein GCM10010507_60500 [Streptomyces cinnamoneus]|uniref:Pyrrolo-quinoline quinone repeat domain-containing protein n=2 Tax=Streptomyces cinnamoneus TaxID=53446 RepID=A0A918WQ34_STRCJ|nr:hypothetical protein GCM10010507_60500 [Streptomyces cinnamoneus]